MCKVVGSGEFGPFTIRPSGIFGEFRLLVGEFGPQLENSANYPGEFGLVHYYQIYVSNNI